MHTCTTSQHSMHVFWGGRAAPLPHPHGRHTLGVSMIQAAVQGRA